MLIDIFVMYSSLHTPRSRQRVAKYSAAGGILLSVRDVSVLIGSLPPVGATMAVMLAVSHVTYLVAKAADINLPKGAPPKDSR
jgi:hypothetical protein